MIRNQIKNDLILRIVLNGFGFIFTIIIVYSVGFVGAFIFSYKYAWAIALAWTAILLSIGIFSKYKGYSEESRMIDVPWEVDSVGSYIARREVLKVTGTAFVISEILMSSAACVVNMFGHFKRMTMLLEISENDIAEELKPLQMKAKSGSRFVDLKTARINAKVIKPLLLSGVVWYKKDGDALKIGINRKYDDYLLG